MPTPSVRAPAPQDALHLYRYLLREATYLPPICRPFFWSTVRDRFRKHRRDPAPDARLRRARHDFRFIRAANMGDMKRMRHLMLLTFGRTGRRRRLLLDNLTRKEPPTDSAALEELINATQRGSASAADAQWDDWLAKWDVDKIRVFLASQVKAQSQIQQSPVPPLKSKQLDPSKTIPAENSWGKPLHPRVARTKLKNRWKELISRVLPPVPTKEWELLRDLASGVLKGPEWDIPSRRLAARPVYGESEAGWQGVWDWAKYASDPVRHVERKNSRRFRPMAGNTDDSVLPDPSRATASACPGRVLRRLYHQVWQMTAKMERKTDGSGWDIKWGGFKPRPSNSVAVHSHFIEGTYKIGETS